jgi:hypothetical protein
MNSRRKALSLAAILAATVLTGGAAILGMAHGSQPLQAAPAAVAQSAQILPAPQEEGD